MSEVRRTVSTIEVDRTCDSSECQYGRMKFNGVVFSCNPPRYQHRCDECGTMENFGKVYPFVEYKKSE